MPYYVVYEIWTRSRIIEAKDSADAYNNSAPPPTDRLIAKQHFQTGTSSSCPSRHPRSPCTKTIRSHNDRP